jgi:hypothetical protein
VNVTQPARRTWWDRNWKWFVPVGCLSVLVLLAGFVAIVGSIVIGAMRSSDAYKHAVAEARKSPEVVEALGTPLREGLFASGSIDVKGPYGTASLAIPLSGPKGEGTVYVEAAKSAGEWKYSTLLVEVKENGRRIDLLKRDAERGGDLPLGESAAGANGRGAVVP